LKEARNSFTKVWMKLVVSIANINPELVETDDPWSKQKVFVSLSKLGPTDSFGSYEKMPVALTWLLDCFDYFANLSIFGTP